MADRPIRVLALSPIPEEGAGCRFRIAQFVPYLEAHGFSVTLRTLFTARFFNLVYQRGQYVRKAIAFVPLAIRHALSLRDVGRFDVVFLYREMFPIGPAVTERVMSRRGWPPVIFDFDDAIFLPSVSDANRVIATLKQPSKTATIISRVAHVIVGNEYLASYARRFSQAVTTIPTCVDTDRYVPRTVRALGNGGEVVPVIGWIGSPTTAPFLRALYRVFTRLSVRHRFVLRVSGAGEAIAIDGVTVENAPWSLEREVALFNTCDIGVYPLPDDEWSRGKCGFKAIEFMACGVPVVASPVGVNREIVEDGVNGFLASSEAEWADRLERLLTDATLRRRFAAEGRRTVEDRYSLRTNAPRLAETLRAVIANARGDAR
jgi:glycosyltransferase involved in cell wall biosynthesis